MNNLNAHWNNICKIYFLTKHYLLLSEELSDDFDTFLQPLKEHRDAFDHIIRVYGYKMLEKKMDDIDKYQEDNMKKAIGHTYRAFFDTADWLSYICRKKIREIVSRYNKEQISERYDKYEDVKKKLVEIPKQIAQIRENKDLSDNESVLIEEVASYSEILDQLIGIYHEVYSLFT